MSRLIDKDALEDAVQCMINIMESHGVDMMAASIPVAIIKGAPTVDAVPVEWLKERMQKPQTTCANPFGFVLTEWLEEQEAR